MNTNKKKKLAVLKPKKKCRYCHLTEDLTYDHKVPIVQGGTDDPKNIQVLCKRCNMIKSGLSHNEVRRLFAWFKSIESTRTKPWFPKNNYDSQVTPKKNTATG